MMSESSLEPRNAADRAGAKHSRQAAHHVDAAQKLLIDIELPVGEMAER
jgi:hypothetical protein